MVRLPQHDGAVQHLLQAGSVLVFLEHRILGKERGHVRGGVHRGPAHEYVVEQVHRVAHLAEHVVVVRVPRILQIAIVHVRGDVLGVALDRKPAGPHRHNPVVAADKQPLQPVVLPQVNHAIADLLLVVPARAGRIDGLGLDDNRIDAAVGLPVRERLEAGRHGSRGHDRHVAGPAKGRPRLRLPHGKLLRVDYDLLRVQAHHFNLARIQRGHAVTVPLKVHGHRDPRRQVQPLLGCHVAQGRNLDAGQPEPAHHAGAREPHRLSRIRLGRGICRRVRRDEHGQRLRQRVDMLARVDVELPRQGHEARTHDVDSRDLGVRRNRHVVGGHGQVRLTRLGRRILAGQADHVIAVHLVKHEIARVELERLGQSAGRRG